MTCENAAELRATLRKASRSSPSRSAKTRPSAIAKRLSPRMRLTASLARPASPILPMWKWRANSACNTPSAARITSASPPISPTPLPRATWPLAPETGVSKRRSPRLPTRSANSVMRSGSQVLAQSTILAERSAAAGNSSRSITSSTWSVLNTARTMGLQRCARSPTQAAGRPPDCASFTFLAPSTSKPMTAKPAPSKRLTNAWPNRPRPTTPTDSVMSLPRRFALRR